ncbi:hypothetical protein J6590_040699 [Homalodisca vitripennis]|nr:hypothetical protein J6590_040699 [Homalodisca vitripennis]
MNTQCASYPCSRIQNAGGKRVESTSDAETVRATDKQYTDKLLKDTLSPPIPFPTRRSKITYVLRAGVLGISQVETYLYTQDSSLMKKLGQQVLYKYLQVATEKLADIVCRLSAAERSAASIVSCKPVSGISPVPPFPPGFFLCTHSEQCSGLDSDKLDRIFNSGRIINKSRFTVNLDRFYITSSSRSCGICGNPCAVSSEADFHLSCTSVDVKTRGAKRSKKDDKSKASSSLGSNQSTPDSALTKEFLEGPLTANEDVGSVIVDVGKFIGITLQPEEMVVDPTNNRPITFKMVRDEWIAKVRERRNLTADLVNIGFPKRRVFISEHLTPETDILLSRTKDRCKSVEWRYVLFWEGKVFAR